MKVSELLTRGWCQGTYARDLRGQEVLLDSDEAVSWCFVGAMRRAFLGNNNDDSKWRAFYKLAADRVGSVLGWNDKEGRTQDQAITLACEVEEMIAHQEEAK